MVAAPPPNEDRAKNSMRHLPLDGGGWEGVGPHAPASPPRLLLQPLDPHQHPLRRHRHIELRRDCVIRH